MQHSRILSTTYLRVFHKIVIDNLHARSVLSPGAGILLANGDLIPDPGKDPCRRTLATIVRRPAAWGNTGHVVPASLHDQRNIRSNAIYDRRKRKYLGEVGR
jgi:hypothetical protein